MLLVGLPVPWQQFIDPLGRMIGKFREDIGEPGLRIDVVELAGREVRSSVSLLRGLRHIEASDQRALTEHKRRR